MKITESGQNDLLVAAIDRGLDLAVKEIMERRKAKVLEFFDSGKKAGR